jgi:dCTP diphosphatase
MNGGEPAPEPKKGGSVACDTKVGAEAVSLEELRKRMADFARERDWEQFHSPRNLLLALVRFSLYISSLISFSVPCISGLT